MAVRPFWVEAWIDGRKTNPLAGGPRSKDGAMTVSVLQRNDGSPSKSVQVSCMPIYGPEGKVTALQTTVSVWRNGGYEDIHTVRTPY